MPLIKGKNGIIWNYDIEGEGKTLLFLHGWGVDKRVWRQQSKYFSKKYQVITVDLPGHGQTSWEKMKLTDMCEDLSKILIRLCPGKITVVSSSLGGLFALKMYEAFPEKIERLVMVGSMPKFSKSEDYPYGLDVAEMRKLSGQLDQSYPSIVDVFFRSLFTKHERNSRRFKWLQKFRQFDNKPIKHALMQYLDVLEEEDLRSILEMTKLPMQFINGTEDEICKKEVLNYIRTVQPNARYDFFEQCGHFPFLSKPHEFNQVLESFLEDTD
ncbi:MAG: alpha/beta fold hydrolase [Candidatus Omnitrophica bacterium]|nr:alpha/beta fold hydrolase [Candidatus Omnitrophota bacterium]